MATFKSEKYSGTRITIQSPNSFNEVINKLYSSIGGPNQVDEWKKAAKTKTSYSEVSRKQFEDQINAIIGPHGFMIFQVRLFALLNFITIMITVKFKALAKSRSSITGPGFLFLGSVVG